MNKLFLILTLFFITACDNDTQTPEQQIKAVIADIEQGIEERSLSQVMEHISDDYHDHKSRSKKDIKRYVQLQILRNQNITILSRVKSLDVQNDIASVELSAAAAARGSELNIASVRADTHKASVVLKNDSGDWKVISASLRDIF